MADLRFILSSGQLRILGDRRGHGIRLGRIEIDILREVGHTQNVLVSEDEVRVLFGRCYTEDVAQVLAHYTILPERE